MNLLVVTQYFWPENFRINEIVKSLVENGIRVSVLTGKPNYPEGRLFQGYQASTVDKEIYFGADVLRVPIITRGFRQPLRLGLNYLSFIFSAVLIGPYILRAKRHDVILVYCTSPLLQALPAIILAKIKRIPLAVYVQDLWPESLEATGYVKNRFILGVVGAVVKFIYRKSNLILISSRPFDHAIRKLSPTSKIVYLPNSVSKDFCDPDSGERPEVSALCEGFNVVFAGNLGSAQSIGTIIDAANLLSGQQQIKIVIIGSGSEYDWIAEQIERRGLNNVYLAGRFSADSMPYLLSKASVLLATLADQPIFASTVPNKIQVYMAVGRPIIACMNGEGGRLVTDAQAGLAVKAEDSQGLADAILSLYNLTPDERCELGKNARSYYLQNFDHDKLVTELSENLREIIGSHT